MKQWKKWLPDVVAVVLFAVIAFAYFYSADVDGRILFRHDSAAGIGAGQEASEYYQQTGERTRWSNSIFSGMPTYQTAPSYKSNDLLATAVRAYHLWLPDYVWYVFAYLLGFYILLRALNFRQSLAVLGAVVWAFSSYFFIIIGAGHLWKVMALAYLPPMIAGVVLAYRGHYLWGMALTALFSAFEVNANHVQMTYYYLFIILFMVVAFLIDAIRQKRLAHFGKATAACAVGAAIGIGMNLSNLYHTWEYGQESMRGKSELVKADAANQTDSGLDRDYITAYSYGIGETWSLLIPNVKGGTSERALGQNPLAEEEGNSHYFDLGDQRIPYSYLFNQMPQYWEEPPGTSGPVYVGAFVVFLFVLGLFIVKDSMKWALLVATVLSVLLAWGRNFMPFTDFFIDHVPMYAKFRTVESILVIAEFTMPLLALLALKRVVDEPAVLKQYRAGLAVSLALTVGACLLFALMPSVFFDFINPVERTQLSQILPPELLSGFVASLKTVRMAIFTSDCWRSLLIILFGLLLVWLYVKGKLKAGYMVSAVIVLCLLDMWQVNKRYLNDEMFVEASQREEARQKSPIDEFILQDRSLDYRVLNMPYSTQQLDAVFNENNTAYFHKSIGGYHPAKLRRYQELIDYHIKPEMVVLNQLMPQVDYDLSRLNTDSMMPVLNMLNTKYIVMADSAGRQLPIHNYHTYGNAWLVDHVEYVKTANDEIGALGRMPLRHEAVADERFREQLGESTVQDSTSEVVLQKYEPNRLAYTVKTGKGGVVVFSEIYYPGWKATVDGVEAELGRVDYVLRALRVEPGEHEVVLSFFPRSVDTTETIAYVSYALLLAAVLLAVFFGRKKQ